MTASPTAPPPALPKDLTDALIELSVAVQRRAMYPGGHPTLEAAERRLLGRLGPLLTGHPTLTIGVARDQLVIDTATTDAKHPLIRSLAERLHGHRIAALKLSDGITAPELADFLARLAREPAERAREPLTASAAEPTPVWTHIQVYRQSYERLELADTDHLDATVPAGALWIELARSAIDDGTGYAPGAEIDPSDIASAINARTRDAGVVDSKYEQAVTGYLVQIAGELRTGDSADIGALRNRVSQLVMALTPDAVDRLLRMGGSLSRRRSFLMDATSAMAVDAVLTLTMAAARVSQQVISQPMLRLLVKLAGHSQRGAPLIRSAADSAVRDHVRELINGWTLPDPSTGGYGRVLDHLALPAEARPIESGVSQLCEPERVVEVCLELRNSGPALWDAVAALVARGDIDVVFDTLDKLPPDDPVVALARTRLATPEHFRALLDSPSVSAQRIEELARRVGAPATEALLDALAGADGRAVRRRLLDVLAKLGDGVGAVVVNRLPGAPWYVQRNLLLIMGGMTTWPAGFTPATYVGHADARVRREALRVLLKRADLRTIGIIAAVGDADPQLVRLGLDAAIRACPSAAVLRIVQRLDSGTLSPELHVPALQAIAGSGAPAALACLLETASYRTRWLKRVRVAPKSAAVLAALAGLATYWSDNERVAALLARAAHSQDRAIRTAAATTTPTTRAAEPPTLARELPSLGTTAPAPHNAPTEGAWQSP
ncbi:MAG TPA: hypothetical protein VNW46_05660 [Gemmatimonadaceae bacterium]|nr:hypothetical protein [Gemmatimonadaceae bacterium]